MTSDSEEKLQSTFRLIATAAHNFQDDWWIIGSAAAKAAGADIQSIKDVDLLTSARDFEALAAIWAASPSLPEIKSYKFRSRHFRRFEGPLPIEVMADFELLTQSGDWLYIQPRTHERFGDIYAPGVVEQIALLRLMGRPKDQARIAALEKLLV